MSTSLQRPQTWAQQLLSAGAYAMSHDPQGEMLRNVVRTAAGGPDLPKRSIVVYYGDGPIKAQTKGITAASAALMQHLQELGRLGRPFTPDECLRITIAQLTAYWEESGTAPESGEVTR